MPFPPIEEAPRSMTRRHYLVELNRRRVKAYEPTRKALEEEDLRLAQTRDERRKKMLDSWKSQTCYNADSTRPLPGGGPRSRRMTEVAAIKNPNTYKIIKDEEAELKARRRAIHKAEMMQQLKEREEYLRKWREDEDMYVTSLVESRKEQTRKLEEREREDARAQKEYMDRVRETNLRELEQKRFKQKEREEYELSLIRAMQENDRKKAADDERRAKDVKRAMQMENEENARLSKKKQKEDKARDEAELKAILEYDAALAERERQEELRKKEQFKAEFKEAVAKQKELKEMYNYDEPPEVTRERAQKEVESVALIKQEEKLRLADRRREYRDELLRQIREKQAWRLEHLDGI